MTALSSVLLGIRDPDRLRGWYRDMFGAEPDADGFQLFGDVEVLVDGWTDLAATTAEPGRVVLNHHVNQLGLGQLVR